MHYLDKHILVCTGKSCGPLGGATVREALKSELKARGLRTRIRDGECTCLGLCCGELNTVIWPEGLYLSGIRVRDVPRIVDYLEGKGPLPEDLKASADAQIQTKVSLGK